MVRVQWCAGLVMGGLTRKFISHGADPFQSELPAENVTKPEKAEANQSL